RLRDKLSELLRAHNINEEDLFKAIQDLEITYNEDNLLKLVNPGATVNGNYVLNYTNDVSSNIKTLFRQKTNDLYELIIEAISCRHDDEIKQLKKKLNEAKQTAQIEEKNSHLEKTLNKSLTELDKSVTSLSVDEKAIKTIEKIIKENNEVLIEEAPVLSYEEEFVQ